MKSTISKSLQDLLSGEVIGYVIRISLYALLLSVLVVWLFWDTLTGWIGAFLGWIPWEWLQHTGAGIVNVLLIYMLFIIIVSVLTSLTSETLLKRVAQRHYPQLSANGTPNISKSLLLSLKAAGLFLLLFIPSLPLLFVPILGQLLMLYLWSLLIKKPTAYDVGSLFSVETEISTGKRGTLLAMTASLFNYLPLLNIFTPVFAQILFLHDALSSKREKTATAHQSS